MVKKRGRCPSLIGGTHGTPKLEIAKAKRTCKRCKSIISKGIRCISVPIPGSMGRKIYCHVCMQEIVIQTQKKLDDFKNCLNKQEAGNNIRSIRQ